MSRRRLSHGRLGAVSTAVVLAVALGGCDVVADIGAGIDQTCIVGKISAEEAATLNAAHPKWADPPAIAGDRVVNGACSSALRGVTQGD